jgi:pimeloyl-ACP methyl ester carboxylesterase
MTPATQVRPDRTATVPFHVAPALVRAAFRHLERWAPALGAAWAERIWFALPPPAARGPGVPGPATGVPFAVDVDGHEVVGETWGQGPTVYLVHGWAGHGGQLAAFVPPLLAQGLRVVAFDAPSHGRSAPGKFGRRSSSLPELAAALSAVIEMHGPAHAVVAHSMGANAAAVLLGDGLRVGRLVMLAPMASVTGYAQRFITVLGAGERIRHRLLARIERRVRTGLHRFEVPDLPRAAATPPTLILHDRTDATIPVTDGEAIAAAWPSARLRTTSGLGHRRLLSDPDSVAAAVEFVTRGIRRVG